MRTQDPSFLPAFDPLAKYFNSSGLDAEVAAGSLCAIESQLSSLGLEADRRLPYYLSFVLSKNAVAQETLPTPVLGQPDEYHLSVSTANPTQFSYSGQLRFQVRSSVPVYSSDFVSGDAISDAYPNGSAAVIALDGVQAGGSLAFNFQKAEQPAQITSSQDSCALSSQDGAQVVRSIAFSSSRSLDYLGISELASSSASDAYAQFGGSRQPLQVAWAEGGSALQGRIGPVSQGRNSLSVGFSVSQPFAVRQGARSYTLIGNGSQQVSFVLSLENVSLDCSSAQIEISEPFAVSGFSALPLAGGGKVSQAVAASSPSGSQMSFLLSPLAAGSSPQVAVSYVVSDPQLALSEALQQAQLQVLYYNRSSDALALSEAESLSAQNRSEEALSLLSAMLQQGQQLSAGGFADYRQFLDENASAASQLASALQAQSQLSTGNMTGAAAQLSVATAKFSDALAAASAQVQGSGYSGALSSVKKAEAAFRTSLSSLAWTAVSDAQEQYAKARKAADPAQPYAPTAQKGISGAQSLFAQGDYLGAFVDAAQADADMASADEAVASGDAAASAQEAALASQFASLKQETDSLLSNYSSEYSVLSSQSKRQLPTTPSALRGQIDDAAKAMAAASKPGVAPRQALEQANASYQSIAAAHKLVSDSLEQVRSLAQSSLEVARTAAAQAAKQPGADASQIAGEVSRAEEFYSNALYADSLVSSENAISAANLLLSQNSGGLDVRAVLIACASLAFIAAAAWFFLRGGRGGKKKEKKELPKAES